MLYLFYGDDDLARGEYLASLLARVSDPMGDLNQTRLAVEKLTFGELRHACDSLPFLSDRRIVIVEGLLGKLAKRGPKEFAEQLREYASVMPDHTRLFLLEEEVDRRTTLWKSLNKLAGEKQPVIYLKEFAIPPDKAMPEWVQARAQRHGGKIDKPTAMALATFVGRNVRLLDQEIRKLVTYAGERPVTMEDVRLLVPYVQEATVWEMVDAIGTKEAKKALAAAHQILREDPGKAIYLHLMIVRQVRMLLQVKSLQELGKQPNEIQQTLGLSPFVLNKVAQQAGNFSIPFLERAFERLLDADVAMKSGADQTLTLNLLIVELASRRAA